MNILNNFDKRYDMYANIKHAKVLSLDIANRTCDCIGTDLSTVYANVNFNSSFLGTNNFVAPQVGSLVTIALLDAQTSVLLSISNPSTYNITTVDENGEIIENLKNVLNEQTNFFIEFKNKLKDCIQAATFSSPMGVTVATPLNWANFENTFNEFENNLNNINDKFNKLFS